MSDIITRDENGDLAVRTVSATASETESEYDDLYARTSDGKRALRVVGGGSGGGDVSSVNGQKGDVVLTGADINATLTGSGEPVTATVTEHLQTLKNDESVLDTQVSGIEEKIPDKASATNQLATMEDIPAGSGLPDQEGHTGFLQTDGTNATWSDKEALVNNINRNGSIVVGKGATLQGNDGSDGIAIGTNTQILQTGVGSQIAIGHNARHTLLGYPAIAIGDGATTSGQRGNIAIGRNATASKDYAIQIGEGTNSVAKSFNVSLGTSADTNYQLLAPGGLIPSERLATAGTTGQVLSKTDTGMAWVDAGGGSGWDFKSLTIKPDVAPTYNDDLTLATFVDRRPDIISPGDIRETSYKITTISGGSIKFMGLSYSLVLGLAADSSNQDFGYTFKPWRMLRARKLSNPSSGTDNEILIPQTQGTMVVATPPTGEGTYVLKATVAADGTVTTTWVAE